jgi:hypothetical protein
MGLCALHGRHVMKKKFAAVRDICGLIRRGFIPPMFVVVCLCVAPSYLYGSHWLVSLAYACHVSLIIKNTMTIAIPGTVTPSAFYLL